MSNNRVSVTELDTYVRDYNRSKPGLYAVVVVTEPDFLNESQSKLCRDLHVVELLVDSYNYCLKKKRLKKIREEYLGGLDLYEVEYGPKQLPYWDALWATEPGIAHYLNDVLVNAVRVKLGPHPQMNDYVPIAPYDWVVQVEKELDELFPVTTVRLFTKLFNYQDQTTGAFAAFSA